MTQLQAYAEEKFREIRAALVANDLESAASLSRSLMGEINETWRKE